MIIRDESRKTLRSVEKTSSLSALGLSTAALWCWLAGVGDLLSWGGMRIPMAPSTAACLALLGFVSTLRSYWPNRAWICRARLVATCLVSVPALFAGLRPLVGWASPIEEWLAQTGERIGNVPLGQMSPVTGGLILLCALAGLCQPSRSGERRTLNYLPAVCASVVLVSAMTLVLSYLLGKPLLYESSLIPVALWTALTLLCLGTALSCEAGLCLLQASSETGRQGEREPNWLPFLVTFGLALVVIAFTGIYLRNEQSQDREDARELLAAIGKLKQAEIVAWREERLKDARFFQQADFVSSDFSDFLQNPHSTSERQKLSRWLELLKGGDRYSLVALFNTNAVLQIAVADRTNSTWTIAPTLFQTALNASEPVVSQLHQGEDDPAIHIDIAFPIRKRAAGASPSQSLANSLGVGLLRVNPRNYLFPLVQSWPTPSRTAETVLFRREGNDVLYLNELRHQTNGALSLRFPVTPGSPLPAVKALLGQMGTLEGVDYRGVPVLADVHKVPNSSWFLAAKVDCQEIYAPLRRQAWMTLILTTAFVGSAGLGAGWVSKRSETKAALRSLKAERREHDLAQRIEHLMRYANDAILIADEEDHILEANQKALELYDFTLEELQAMKLPDLRTPEARAVYGRDRETLMHSGSAVLETRHRRKDGSEFPVEISGNVVSIGQERYRLDFLRDISLRKMHEREIERLNRYYVVLSEVNQTILKVRTPAELYDELCRILVEFGRFKLVWLGEGRKPQVIRSLVRGEQGAMPMDDLKEASRNSEGLEPVETALAKGRACVVNEFAPEDLSSPWRELALRHQLRAVAVLPLRMQGEVRGALALYSDESGVFQAKEMALLEDMSLDISFALDRFKQEEARLETEAALHLSEARLRTLVEHIQHRIFVKDRNSLYTYINQNYAQDLRTTPEAILGKSDFDFFPKTLAEQYRADDCRVMESGRAEEFDEKYLHDGREVWIHTVKAPLREKNGTIIGVFGIFRDVTESVLAAAALRASEEQFRAMFELASIGMAQAEPHTGRLLRVNARLCFITGYTAEELLAMSFLDLTFPDDRERDWELFQRLMRQELTEYQVEKRYVRKDGNVLWANVNVTLLRDASGKPARATATIEDITERKQAEQVLRQRLELQNQLSRIAATVPGMVFSFRRRPDGTFCMPYASGALEAIFELNPESVREDASAVFALIHPDDLEKVRKSILASGENLAPWREEFRLCLGHRGERWVEGHSVPQLEPLGSILWQGFVQDVTQRKQAEEQLRKLSRAVEQSPVSIVITNPKGEIEYINPKFTELTGYDLKFALGKNPRILKTDATSPVEHKRLWETITAGATWRGEFCNRKKSGELFWEFATISPITDETGSIRHYLAVKEDITERRRLEEQLRQSQKLEAIGQLAGGVAHDFNNLLAAMMMQVEISARTPNVPDEVRNGLGEIRHAVERAANLTRQLLLFSRKQVMQPRELDLNAVVINLTKMLQRIIGEDVHLQLNLHPRPLYTRADAGMLDQVLMNLVVNSRDAMPGGGRLLIETSEKTFTREDLLRMPDARPGRHVQIKVTDTGCGIAPENLPRIFEPFFTTKAPGKGTGLGLATVFGIIKQHDGILHVESKLGHGSTFAVFLLAAELPREVPIGETESAKPRGGSETILLVEDEAGLRKVTRIILERHGYKVLEATDGQDALRVCREYSAPIHLLLTDIVMPKGIDGKELAARLKNQYPQLRVILVSGYSSEFAGRELTLEAGQFFVQKPCPPPLLLETIRKSLDA